jgi:hypothetical protein
MADTMINSEWRDVEWRDLLSSPVSKYGGSWCCLCLGSPAMDWLIWEKLQNLKVTESMKGLRGFQLCGLIARGIIFPSP